MTEYIFSGLYLTSLALGKQDDSHSNNATMCDAYMLQYPSYLVGSRLNEN